MPDQSVFYVAEQFRLDLLTALGLSPDDRVTHITIDVPSQGLPTATITKKLDDRIMSVDFRKVLEERK